MYFNTKYPTSYDLRKQAKKRIPGFAFDYLENGCLHDVGRDKNIRDFQKLHLKQNFIREKVFPNMKASLSGIDFDMPFGIAPVGLQGLIWPDAPLILAKAAARYNIPYILSTVSTASIERVAEASDGQALFQLYNPKQDHMRTDILHRVQDAGYRALFVTIDVTSFGYRPKDIQNGLGLPPKITPKSITQSILCPTWSLNTLKSGGMPVFETLLPYMDKQDTSMGGLARFMNEKMGNAVTVENIKFIRDIWKGPLIAKGVMGEPDMEMCIELGLDGAVISNHGGRQLDGGQSAISVLPDLAQKYGDKIDISFDSGIRSATDIAMALSAGAKFTFMGRAWMYGVGALGNKGTDHTVEMFRRQLEQVMTQMGCETVDDLQGYCISA